MELIDVNVKWSQEEWILNCHCVKKNFYWIKLDQTGMWNREYEAWHNDKWSMGCSRRCPKINCNQRQLMSYREQLCRPRSADKSNLDSFLSGPEFSQLPWWLWLRLLIGEISSETKLQLQLWTNLHNSTQTWHSCLLEPEPAKLCVILPSSGLDM